MIDTPIAITVPEMTIDRYAEHVGVSVRTVQGWIDKGYLASVKIGKRRMVNVIQRTTEIAQETA